MRYRERQPEICKCCSQPILNTKLGIVFEGNYVIHKGIAIKLSNRLKLAVECLTKSNPRIATRTAILDYIESGLGYGEYDVDLRTVDSLIKKIRVEFKKANALLEIKTARSLGYILLEKLEEKSDA